MVKILRMINIVKEISKSGEGLFIFLIMIIAYSKHFRTKVHITCRLSVLSKNIKLFELFKVKIFLSKK